MQNAFITKTEYAQRNPEKQQHLRNVLERLAIRLRETGNAPSVSLRNRAWNQENVINVFEHVKANRHFSIRKILRDLWLNYSLIYRLIKELDCWLKDILKSIILLYI